VAGFAASGFCDELASDGFVSPIGSESVVELTIPFAMTAAGIGSSACATTPILVIIANPSTVCVSFLDRFMGVPSP
jgi:hypothetical protein